MKLLRLFSLLLPTIAVNLVLPSAFAAEIGPLGPQGTSIPFYDRAAQTQRMWLLDGYDRFESYSPYTRMTIVKTPTDGGIREDVPAKYKERFEKWKAELLSTDFGKEQWDKYANNKQFVLTIVVRSDRDKGAGTDNLLWDDKGELVGATITLGADIERGYPSPIYYPVLNSLSPESTTYAINGKILAATKISHEIGHVNQAAAANTEKLQLQNKLMPVYTSIFLKNGLDMKDKKLVDLAGQMGGTPTEIWESREYWSEVNAMTYLKQRISKEEYYCYVFNRIKMNLETYAKDYESRFDALPAAETVCRR